MKLKREFITHVSGGQSLLVPTGSSEFSGVVRGNETTGAILECLKSDVTRDDIIARLEGEYDAPRDRIERGVDKVIDALRSIGAIDE